MDFSINKHTNNIILSLGLVLVYYASIAEIPLIGGILLYFSFYIILLVRSDLHAFLFAYFLCIDITGTFIGFMFGSKLITLFSMFFIFVKSTNNLSILLSDIKARKLLVITILFSLYFILVSSMLKVGSVSIANIIILNINFAFGFLIFIPAYHLTMKNYKEFFSTITFVAFVFIVLSMINLFTGGSIFGLNEGFRSVQSDITRMGASDLRQTFVFFIFLIPASLFISNKHSAVIVRVIGILSFIILLVGLLRLAIFYIFLGTFLSFRYIMYYYKITRLLTFFLSVVFLITVGVVLFPDLINNYLFVATWTINSLQGNTYDSSYDIRFLLETPFLIEMFLKDIWLGMGLEKLSLEQENFGYFAIQDVPILGTLATYGIIGMAIYYLRYYYLLTNNNIRSIKLTKNNQVAILVFLTLKAYIITMITFRLFYISWELTYDYQLVEFGLFSGVFLGLRRIILEKRFS
jgi:hypothetical protein